MNIRNLRLGARLGLSFGAVLLLTVAMAAMSVMRLQSVLHASGEMEGAKKKAELAELWYSGNLYNDAMTEARLRAFSADDAHAIDAKMKEKSAEVSKAKQALADMIVLEEGKRLLARTAELRAVYLDLRSTVFKELDSGKTPAELKDLIDSKMRPALVAYDESVAELAARQRRVFDEAKASVDATVDASKILIIVCGTLALALGAGLAWLLTVSITRPLDEAVEVARTVAEGDLTARIEVRSKDETGQLMAAMQAMTANLNRIVARVRTGTETISTGSTQIAAGNQDLSARTEQQASSLEETASSMEELTSTVQQNAENARMGNQLAASASQTAEKGGGVVSQVVSTMGEIHASAKKVVDIIAVIDGIAFQTNILALNAAVEAARAGEQGRGFAVVAGEVRTLAQRSAAAAKEIKALIDDSVSKVETGTRLVNEAGMTMADVVDSVKRVSDIMSEIASASQEQRDGIEQVNQAITQMDEMTQQNAALVEEAAAAASSMQDQAVSLTEAVSLFKLDGGAVQAVAARPVRTAIAAPAPVQASSRARVAAPAPARRAPAKAAAEEWEEF
jgi:methyl-accepting chemotaxis protein